MSRARHPLERWVDVARLPQGRGSVTVQASEAECAALARDFRIEAVRDLVGRFAVGGHPARLTVTGAVEAVVTQVCTVTLEPFEAPVREAVDVVFSDAPPSEPAGEDEADAPDPLVNGRVDFGALTAEHLALGLDPYPRRPGATFEPVQAGEDPKPFDALRRLRDDAD